MAAAVAREPQLRALQKRLTVGWTPRPEDLELTDLPASRETVEAALAFDPTEWRSELALQGQWLDDLGATVPRALRLQRDLLLAQTETMSKRGGAVSER